MCELKGSLERAEAAATEHGVITPCHMLLDIVIAACDQQQHRSCHSAGARPSYARCCSTSPPPAASTQKAIPTHCPKSDYSFNRIFLAAAQIKRKLQPTFFFYLLDSDVVPKFSETCQNWILMTTPPTNLKMGLLTFQANS